MSDATLPAPLPRWKRALFAGLLLVPSLGLGLLGVEKFARWRERQLALRPQQAGGLELMRENPHGSGSYRLKPGLDVVTRVRDQTVHIRTNSFGMHWREVAREKPARTRRVVFLGDSFTFGCWTPSLETSFVGIFAGGLPARTETLNFGVGGYGLDDMELQLREDVLDFAPDWVIVTVFTGNDFRDTYLGLDKHRLVDGTAELREDVLAERVPAEFLQAPYFPSPPAEDPWRLRAALERRLATVRLLLPALGWENPWVEFKVCRKFTSFSFWSQQPPPDVVLRAKDALLGALGRMDALAREHGARLAVVTIPTREQVYCRAESGRDFDVQLPQAWVRVFARERGIPFLDLWTPLRERALRTGQDVYLANDIHFGERGHALAGEWIREWFLSEVRAQAPPRPFASAE